MKMNKVVISGYYGFDNLGDEAILLTLINQLKKINPKLTITVLSARPDITASRYDVDAIVRTDIPSIISVIKSCDLFISGGGSLLQDVTGLKSIPYYLSFVYLAQLFNKKTVFYGQGIGPVNNKFYQQLIKHAATKAEWVSVRDNKSYDLLKQWGVAQNKLFLSIDPVLSLTENDLASINSDQKKQTKAKKPLIGISVRPWQNENYLQPLSEAINQLGEQIQAEFVIIPLYPQQDVPTAEKLAALLNSPVKIVKKTKSPLEMISFFSKLDFLIGVRLHSLIFAACNQIPFFALSYDPKVTSFVSSLNHSEYVSLNKPLSVEKTKQKLNDSWQNKAKLKQELQSKQKIWKKESKKNYLLLRDVLKGESDG